jgi:hypothetical protein
MNVSMALKNINLKDERKLGGRAFINHLPNVLFLVFFFIIQVESLRWVLVLSLITYS